jgi:hypothetical protein
MRKTNGSLTILAGKLKLSKSQIYKGMALKSQFFTFESKKNPQTYERIADLLLHQTNHMKKNLTRFLVVL